MAAFRWRIGSAPKLRSFSRNSFSVKASSLSY